MAKCVDAMVSSRSDLSVYWYDGVHVDSSIVPALTWLSPVVRYGLSEMGGIGVGMKLKRWGPSDQRSSRGSDEGVARGDLGIDDPGVLAARIFALAEPWRGRFIGYIADAAGYRNGRGAKPSQAQVARWLRDRRLFRQVKAMVDTWT